MLLVPLLALRSPVAQGSLSDGQDSPAQRHIPNANARGLASSSDSFSQAHVVPASEATVVAAPASALPQGEQTRAARLLVLAADGTEPALGAITQTLDYLGTPYTVWVAGQHPGGLTADQLFSGTHSYYQGVMLTSDSLSISPDGGATWQSALTDDEWATLWRYEAAFGLRQAIWYAKPTPLFGFGPSIEVDSASTPLTATLTNAGKPVFAYLNPATAITIQDVMAYVAAVDNKNATPLLVDAQGHALVAVRTFPDGRQNLLLTFDNAASAIHTLALAYGVVNWVTGGLFLGERHVALSAQVDDVFIPNDIWLPGTPCAVGVSGRAGGATYRMNGEDLWALVAWQERARARPTTSNLRLNLAFNGLGTTNVAMTDTLLVATEQLQAHFAWISHTYSHLKLDAMDYPTSVDEIKRNNSVAAALRLSEYNPASLVTPEVSGLANPQFLRAAHDQGLRYLVSDTSKADQDNPSPNAGRMNGYQPAILEIPRRPTELEYNVSQPAEWVAEYNCLNRSTWGRDLSYQEILDTESNTLLQYLLTGELDPWMFHQANLRAYDGAHSLLSDLLDQTLAKYNRLSTLPILSPTMDVLGAKFANRMQYDMANVTATIGSSSITLTAQHDAIVPITGLQTNEAERYGTAYIAHLELKAGQSVTIPLPPAPYRQEHPALVHPAIPRSMSNAARTAHPGASLPPPMQ